jgi:hypothetical protein
MRSWQSLGAVFKEKTILGAVFRSIADKWIALGCRTAIVISINDVATASFSLQGMKLAVLSISVHSLLNPPMNNRRHPLNKRS